VLFEVQQHPDVSLLYNLSVRAPLPHPGALCLHMACYMHFARRAGTALGLSSHHTPDSITASTALGARCC
jgi:hypothetical protein